MNNSTLILVAAVLVAALVAFAVVMRRKPPEQQEPAPQREGTKLGNTIRDIMGFIGALQGSKPEPTTGGSVLADIFGEK